MVETQSIEKWLKTFEEENKRKPKILHMGNIANNAYHNSKILNQQGYESDVLCNDYYHCMGCPEWDEANFDGNVDDANFPRWDKINLNGYKRPKWFVQGPGATSVKYLFNKNKGNIVKSKLYWVLNEYSRKEILLYKDFNKITLRKIFGIIRFLRLVKTYIKGFIRILKNSDKSVCNNTENKLLHGLYLSAYEQELEKIKLDFVTLFPDRECKFDSVTLDKIQTSIGLKPLFDQYDIIVMYATNPIFAYCAGVKNYIAYEHGTIRDMPYEENELGRLLLLSYARAGAIYVTNLDCYDSAKYITRNTKTPIVCGLHGIDINQVIESMEHCSFDVRFGVDEKETLFFCPSRHDYDDLKKTFVKCEDKMLLAASVLAEEEYDFKIVMVEWGRDTEKIKRIIDNYENLGNHIIWINPLKKHDLYQVYANVEAVADQFYYKGYGAITFEVLASNRSVLISSMTDEKYQKMFFGDLVPYFACNEENEIYYAMKSVICKDEKYLYLKQNERSWVKEHHSNERILEALEKAFYYSQINIHK